MKSFKIEPLHVPPPGPLQKTILFANTFGVNPASFFCSQGCSNPGLKLANAFGVKARVAFGVKARVAFGVKSTHRLGVWANLALV